MTPSLKISVDFLLFYLQILHIAGSSYIMSLQYEYYDLSVPFFILVANCPQSIPLSLINFSLQVKLCCVRDFIANVDPTNNFLMPTLRVYA